MISELAAYSWSVRQLAAFQKTFLGPEKVFDRGLGEGIFNGLSCGGGWGVPIIRCRDCADCAAGTVTCCCSSVVERVLGKDEVMGSTPISSLLLGQSRSRPGDMSVLVCGWNCMLTTRAGFEKDIQRKTTKRTR